jgi:hypothetical protein
MIFKTSRFLILGLCVLLSRTMQAALFTVTTTADAGVGSLRQAIIDANGTVGADIIVFTIPGAGVHTITPLSPLPAITETVMIDGYTQPGSSEATATTPATILIELNGTSAGAGASGFSISGIPSGSTTISGIAINRFNGPGITITNSEFVNIFGNYIGTDTTGTLPLGNTGGGIFLTTSTFFTFIGGVNPGGSINPAQSNIISANGSNGIFITNDTNNTFIRGNFIGTNFAGQNLGNNGAGVFINGSAVNLLPSEFNNFSIGNTIAFNSGAGVAILPSNTISTSAIDNVILNNSIYSNVGLGIDLRNNGVTPNDLQDLDLGPNRIQNFPVLLSATRNGSTLTVNFTLNTRPFFTYRIQFFGNAAPDPSGFGQGQLFLGEITVFPDAMGNVIGSANIPLESVNFVTPPFISSTATNAVTDDTSEFSNNVAVIANDLVTTSLVQFEVVSPIAIGPICPTINFVS